MKLKKKKQNYIWPTIINTSSISITEKIFNRCIEKEILEKFNFLDIITLVALRDPDIK